MLDAGRRIGDAVVIEGRSSGLRAGESAFTMPAMQQPFVASSQDWPVLRIDSPTTEVAIESFFDIIDGALARGQTFGVLHDIRGMPGINAAQRKAFADYIDRQRTALAANIVAHGVVVKRSLERGIVTAVLWLSPTPFPVRVFTSPREAEDWVRSKLASR